MGRVTIFNGATGLQPFTNGVEEQKELRPSRPVGQDLMLILLLMPPINFRVESRTVSTVSLVWSFPKETTSLVELDRALGEGAFSNIAVLDRGTTSYTDTGLSIGTRYRYRLRLT